MKDEQILLCEMYYGFSLGRRCLRGYRGRGALYNEPKVAPLPIANHIIGSLNPKLRIVPKS